MISRRQLLYFSTLLFFSYPFAKLRCFAGAGDRKGVQRYPLTLDILKKAYWSEMSASRHYVAYCRKAISDNFPNIAYLFSSFSASERIHADNYRKLILSLDSDLKAKEISISVSDTKTNLNTAAKKELKKIKTFYPETFKELSSESHDQAVVKCMYSWKSHQQHEEIIKKIKRYSGIFFGSLASKIEGMNPNYYVCEICGSTRDEAPKTPCEICNRPMSHYKQLKRPDALTG
jgi:rubrerythrin